MLEEKLEKKLAEIVQSTIAIQNKPAAGVYESKKDFPIYANDKLEL